MIYVIPAIFLVVFVFAAIKRVKLYSEFSQGVKEAVEFTVSLIPCLAAIFMMCAVFEKSGLSDMLTSLLSPVFGFLGIPPELTKLVLIKPFSGSGSLTYLNAIIAEHGADSYISRCACVCFGSSAVYFAGIKVKRLAAPIAAVLVATFASTVVACLLCRIM